MRNSCTSRSLGQPRQKPWHKAPWLYAILLQCGMAALPQVKNLCTSMMNGYGITKIKKKKIQAFFFFLPLLALNQHSKTVHTCRVYICIFIIVNTGQKFRWFSIIWNTTQVTIMRKFFIIYEIVRSNLPRCYTSENGFLA